MTTQAGCIRIHPTVEYATRCVACGSTAVADDWRITGLWTLAEIRCPNCHKQFLCDFPYGVGVLAPCFLDLATGEVSRPDGPGWYRELTERAWRLQEETPVELQVITRRTVRRACLVNCLIPWWGDAISLLLRTNQLQHQEDLDIVVLIPEALLWLVPPYVAVVWFFRIGLAATGQGSAGLARETTRLVERFEQCFIPCTFQPAHLLPTELAQFSGVTPFPREAWLERLQERPTVTFMWRTDRCWSPLDDANRAGNQAAGRSRLIRSLQRRVQPLVARSARSQQLRNVIAFAEHLRQSLPKLDFGVCGLGREGALPPWITDLRFDRVTTEVNRQWCERSSKSHVLVGVLGSHMVLPSGHAGAVVELVPNSFLRNVLTDILITTDEPRESAYCYRFLPLDTPAETMSVTVQSLLYNYPYVRDTFSIANYGPFSPEALVQTQTLLQQRSTVLESLNPTQIDWLVGP